MTAQDAPTGALREITDRALDTAVSRGADYADVRVVRRVEESVTVRTGRVESVASDESEGVGIRVFAYGAWGFAATRRYDADAIDRAADEAVRLARAAAPSLRHRVTLAERPRAYGTYATPVREDPFALPLEVKVADLLDADATLAVLGVVSTMSTYAAQREWKTFAATDGSLTEQVFTHVGAGVEAHAVRGNEHQRRSYPEARGGRWRQAGYEFIRELDLKGNAARCGEEAVALLSAPPCPEGLATVVIDPSQLYLQIHESCGHAAELDRVFGAEASYAGTSFLTTDLLDSGFRYGSDLVTLVADATVPGGPGSFGWDDEGVAAQRTTLVENGILIGYLTSRDTAPRVGRASGGTVRAESWNRLPLVRMTNVNLMPVPGMSLQDIVADTDDGLYLTTNRSWSIDDRRWNFQFGTEIAYEIKGGRLGRILKNPVYSGITPEFWRSCDAVADERSYVMYGNPNCAKGLPPQCVQVGHGCSGARFRGVRMGAGR
ncbi:TldD/PmbA family protein [Microtetraspora malaysiensis]|uniref:TldD/PmbA family protein n=1 Tax=Microtetraspora malaysiensis TaxID=161358 RepID=UPI003D91C4D2